MPLDALCLSAVIHELNMRVAGGRIEKVYQPDRDEVVMQIRGGQGPCRLLLSASPSAARMHFIEQNRENPAQPPMFCMLMRKHTQGARIVSVTQPEAERMAIIELDTTDEMGVPVKKHIICELMGKYSNIILQDENGRIIDAIRRVDGDISGKRQILPGLFYHMPPPQENKISPFGISPAGLAAALLQAPGDFRLDKWLLSSFYGFSPLLCRELAYRATGDSARIIGQMTDAEHAQLAAVFGALIEALKTHKTVPELLIKNENNAVFDFSFLPITQYENLVRLQSFQTFSELLAAFYEKKGTTERMHRRAADLLRTTTAARDRLQRKLAAQKMEIEKTHDREQYKRMGELISANFYQLEKGMSTARVIDYFDENCPEIEIQLDVRYTPQQNAQRYFKQYNKAKTAETVLTEQIEQGEREFDYLESVLVMIDEAENEADLAQLREELTQTGVLSHKQVRNAKRQKKSNSAPYEYRTTDGFSVWAGKNNLQNDLLSLKTAFKSDIWFHTQKAHGSHVILVLDGKTPTDQAMTEAAMIAAYHSKARTSSLVPVDYTEVRNLKKPNGAKPGFVIYHVYQTAYVTPDEAKIESLRVK